MLRVIVNVRREHGGRAHDLEVPAEVPSGQLAQFVARAMRWEGADPENPIRYDIKIGSGGRVLRPHDSLADARVWDGAGLVFHPAPQTRVLRFQPAFLVSDAGVAYALNHPEMRIGRTLSATGTSGREVHFVDLKNESRGGTVSRNHACIVFSDGAWTLVLPRATKNQTLLNDKPVGPNLHSQLADGDYIQFGGVRLRFRLGSMDLGQGSDRRKTERTE